MTAPTAPTGPVQSTRVLLTQDAVTWRQATQGWIVLGGLGGLAALTATAFTCLRIARRARSTAH